MATFFCLQGGRCGEVQLYLYLFLLPVFLSHRYKHKLAQQLKIKTIMENLPGESEYLHAKRVQETLDNFISSADDVVEVVHIPELKGKAANVSSLNSREYKLVS